MSKYKSEIVIFIITVVWTHVERL